MLRAPQPYEGFYATRLVARRFGLGAFIAAAAVISSVMLLCGSAGLGVVAVAVWRSMP